MRLIISTFFIFMMGFSVTKAQQNSTQKKVSNSLPADNKAVLDSLARDKKNGTIYTKVNKDGIIEITQKEFDKIPAERQEVMRKDPNYKIIDNK
jgi:hypothetical protein